MHDSMPQILLAQQTHTYLDHNLIKAVTDECRHEQKFRIDTVGSWAQLCMYLHITHWLMGVTLRVAASCPLNCVRAHRSKNMKKYCWNLRNIKYIDMWTVLLLFFSHCSLRSTSTREQYIYTAERVLFLSLSCFTINTTEVRYSLPFYSYILNLHLL